HAQACGGEHDSVWAPGQAGAVDRYLGAIRADPAPVHAVGIARHRSRWRLATGQACDKSQLKR
ncbi:MAG TPA: hypothetical protein VIQ48_11760, partial [Rhodanobacter sp.]